MALLETLQDNFDDNSLDLAKWDKFEFDDTGTIDIVETNNRLEYQLSPGFADGYLVSDAYYSLTGSYVFLEFPFTTFTIPASQFFFQIVLYNNAQDYGVVFQYVFGDLQVLRDQSGSTTVLKQATYNTINHRWLRIRESAGILYFETSPDSNIWSVYHSYTHGVDLTSMQVTLGGGSLGVVTGGQINIDSFNLQQIPATATLTGDAVIATTPFITFYISATLTGDAEIEAIGISLADQSAVEKSYLYKVYSAAGAFLGIWDDVISEFTYDQEINSAGSAIQVELARNSDSRIIQLQTLITTDTSENITTQDSNNLIIASETVNSIGPGTNIDVNLRVEVWAFYGEITELSTTAGDIITTQAGEPLMVNYGAVNGVRRFNGYITRYVSRYGGNETVQVSVASFGIELDNYVLENAGATTVEYSLADPSNILKNALDKFTVAGGRVDYSTSSVALTATSVSYTFRLNTYLEVLRKCLELAPYDWYWYVGLGDDTVYFAAKPTTTSHLFILGKHIKELNLEYSIENITNVVYFTGGEVSAEVNLFKKYTDATSISNYRQGLQRISDHRVTLAASATLIAEAEIDRNATPRYRTSITLLDTAFDIESVQLGQLIGFRNFGNYIDALQLQVVGLSYEPHQITLQLDTLLPSVNKRVEDLRRNLVELDNEQTPTTPT